MEVKDSNGNILNEGDSVQIIKDLKVKCKLSILSGFKRENENQISFVLNGLN